MESAAVKISLEDGYILYEELRMPSVEDLNTAFNEMRRLLKEVNPRYIMVYVADSEKPDAETRYELKKRWLELKDVVDHVAVVTGKNVVLNTAAQFIVRSMGLKSFSVHKTKEEALAAFEGSIK
jgi:hypothetical protein